MKLTASYSNSYKRRNKTTGNVSDVFVYQLTGTPEAIAKYTEIKEEEGYPVVLDEETKRPLFWTTTFEGDEAKIIITTNNKVVVDNDDFNKMQSLMNKVNDPSIKAALAAGIASNMLAEFGVKAASAAPAIAPVAAAAAPADADLDD